MKKKQNVAIVMTSLLLAFIVFVAGSRAIADDLNVTAPLTISSSQTKGTVYVGADLTVQGAGTVLESQTCVYIGATDGESGLIPATGPVKVVVKDDAFWQAAHQEFYFTGAGGLIDLSSSADQPTDGWGKDWLGTGGILGTGAKFIFMSDVPVSMASIPIDPDIPGDKPKMDIVRIGPYGKLGACMIRNQNPNVIARVLFDGSYVFCGNERDELGRFVADAGCELQLVGVEDSNGNPQTIKFRALVDATKTFGGEGVVRVIGKDVELDALNDNGATSIIGAAVEWQITGNLDLKGKGGGSYSLSRRDNLPFGPGVGYVVMRQISGQSIGLDLNGYDQRVNGIFCPHVSGTPFVTNSSSRRVVLEMGEHADMALELNCPFSGPIDIVMKKGVSVSYGSRFALSGGARLIQEQDVLLHNASVSTVTSAEAFAGTLTVSNWCRNVATDPAFIVPGVSRALAPSLVSRLQLLPRANVDVQNGLLGVSDFVGDDTASICIRSNSALSVVSQVPRDVRFIRFVFKEAQGLALYGGKLYPNLKGLCLVDENGDDYWPGDEGFVYQTSDVVLSNMPEGSYKFHSDAFANCKGTSLDKASAPASWPWSGIRSSDYDFDGTSFLCQGGGWGGLLFTNSVPQRSNAETWHTVTLRLKNDGPLIRGYRFVSNWATHFYPFCWAVEGSDDGEVWTLLDEKTDYYSFGYFYSPSSGGDGYGDWNYAPSYVRFPFYWTRNVSDSVSFDLNGAKLRVDKGGVLDVSQSGAPAEVSWLEVDAALGAGHISGFKPMANGVINFVNTQKEGRLTAREHRVELTFEEVVCPENLDTWRVLVDGKELSGAKIQLTEVGLKVVGLGFGVLVR